MNLTFSTLITALRRVVFGAPDDGTHPSITSGSGMPVAVEATGSAFLRDDAPNPDNAAYVRVGAAWFPLTASIGGGSPYEFIFRPAEPAPAGNVFASWAALVAAAAAAVGSKLVYFDDTLAPCVIPAGAWDFGSSTTFAGSDGLPSGSGGPNTTPVTIDDGATLAHVFEFRSLDITSNTTTSVILTPLFGAH